MRATLFLLVAILATAVLTPTISRAETTLGTPLVPAALVPQLTCTTVFDAPGEARCDTAGPIALATTVRVITQGTSRVRVVVGDEIRSVQLAAFDCAGTCTVTIPTTTTPHGTLTVHMTSARPGATIHAHVGNLLGG